MKHGIHFPEGERDDLARLAVGLTRTMSEAEAKKTICGLFDVSEPTARNLISRGRFLSRQEQEGAHDRSHHRTQ